MHLWKKGSRSLGKKRKGERILKKFNIFYFFKAFRELRI